MYKKEHYRLTRLGDVLSQSFETTLLKAGTTYKQVTVRLWGRGVTLRGEIDGSAIAASEQTVVRAEQFIFSRIDARNGAFGIVPPELEGAVVSNDFPTFSVDQQRLLPAYLGWYSKTPAFVQACSAASSGTTNRVRLDGDSFLSLEVLLPPIEEQIKVIRWLGAIDCHRHNASDVISSYTENMVDVGRSWLFSDASNPSQRSFSDLLQRQPLDVAVESAELYQFAGVFSFGRGMFIGKEKRGGDFAYKALSRVKAGQFCYPKLMAWEGAFAVVPPQCIGMVVSPEFPVFNINDSIVLPEVIEAYFKLPEVWKSFADDSSGTNLRRRRLNPVDLLASSMPLPSMGRQLKFREMIQRMRQANCLLDDVKADLKALVPSALAQVFG